MLQVPSVFLNASKGQTAPKEELAKAFGRDASTDAIVLEILNKGELQVGAEERRERLKRVQREVVDIVAGKLVDPRSRRVYTPGMIEKALDQLSQRAAQARQEEAAASSSSATKASGSGAGTPGGGEPGEGKKKEMPTWTGVVATKSAKSQALEAMKALIAWQVIPVSRARMRLRITCHVSMLKQTTKRTTKEAEGDGEAAGEEGGKTKATVKDRILGYVEEVESQGDVGGEWEVVGFIEPGAFKGLSEFIGGETRGKGRVEVLDMAVTHEGD